MDTPGSASAKSPHSSRILWTGYSLFFDSIEAYRAHFAPTIETSSTDDHSSLSKRRHPLRFTSHSGNCTVDCNGAQMRAHCRDQVTVVKVTGDIDATNIDRFYDYTRRFVRETPGLDPRPKWG